MITINLAEKVEQLGLTENCKDTDWFVGFDQYSKPNDLRKTILNLIHYTGLDDIEPIKEINSNWKEIGWNGVLVHTPEGDLKIYLQMEDLPDNFECYRKGVGLTKNANELCLISRSSNVWIRDVDDRKKIEKLIASEFKSSYPPVEVELYDEKDTTYARVLYFNEWLEIGLTYKYLADNVDMSFGYIVPNMTKDQIQSVLTNHKNIVKHKITYI